MIQFSLVSRDNLVINIAHFSLHVLIQRILWNFYKMTDEKSLKRKHEDQLVAVFRRWCLFSSGAYFPSYHLSGGAYFQGGAYFRAGLLSRGYGSRWIRYLISMSERHSNQRSRSNAGFLPFAKQCTHVYSWKNTSSAQLYLISFR